jgi:hypothetical protein
MVRIPIGREYRGKIGGKDCGETTGLTHVASPAARRSPDSNSSRCSGFRK